MLKIGVRYTEVSTVGGRKGKGTHLRPTCMRKEEEEKREELGEGRAFIFARLDPGRAQSTTALVFFGGC